MDTTTVSIHPVQRISLYTQVRCSLEQRGAIGAMLKQARYTLNRDYVLALQVKHSEYNGYLVEVHAKDAKRHEAIVNKIRKFLLATPISFKTENTIKIYQ